MDGAGAPNNPDDGGLPNKDAVDGAEVVLPKNPPGAGEELPNNPGVLLVLPNVVVVVAVGAPKPVDDPKEGVVLPKSPVVVGAGVDPNKLGAGAELPNKLPPVALVGAEEDDPNKPDVGAVLAPPPNNVVGAGAVPNNPVDGAGAPNEKAEGAGAVDPNEKPVLLLEEAGAGAGDPNPKELVVEVGAVLPNAEVVPNPEVLEDPKAEDGALPNKGAEVLVVLPNKPNDGAEVVVVPNVGVVPKAVLPPKVVVVLEGVVAVVAVPLFPAI